MSNSAAPRIKMVCAHARVFVLIYDDLIRANEQYSILIIHFVFG